jgi:hypothetical protein
MRRAAGTAKPRTGKKASAPPLVPGYRIGGKAAARDRKPHTRSEGSDKSIVSRFFDDAYSIFEAAESASRSGQRVSDTTVLIGPDGAIQMLAGSDWPLDRLLAERGARQAYRVVEAGGRVRLEARSGSLTCRLESQTTRRAAWELLGFSPAQPRVETSLLLPAASD